MGIRESKVEKYLDKRIQEIGGITRKWVSPGRDGVPDRIVFLTHRTILVEVKTVDGSLTAPQIAEHDRLRIYATVTTVYGEAGVDEFIRQLLVTLSQPISRECR
jgi:hypothetical protein